MSRILKLDGDQEDRVAKFQRDLQEDIRTDISGSGLDPVSVLADARIEAEQKVQEAYNEGLRRGMEKGEEGFIASVGNASGILEQVTESLEDTRKAFLDELEPQLALLAQAIASRILTYEASNSEEVVRQMARAVLSTVMDQEQVTLRVNPADIEVLRTYRDDLLQTFERIKQLELIPDESVESGGCIAETTSLMVDGQLTSRLQQVIDHLMGV